MKSAAALLALALLADAPAVPATPATPAATAPSAMTLRVDAGRALGYDRLRTFAGVRVRGTFTEAASTGTIDATLAIASGFVKQRSTTGSLVVEAGYDGASWQAQDGVVTVDDLPGDIADSITSAWLGRDGEADVADDTTVSTPRVEERKGITCDVATFVPRGGSPVELWFDRATHLIAHTVAYTDGGPLQSDISSYARFDGVAIAMNERDVDATGAASTTMLDVVTMLPALPDGALARPAAEERGKLTGPGDLPFVSDVLGAEGHIVVPALLDGHSVNVDFDSGGSNALVPEAAQRIGLATSGGLEVGGVGNASEAARTGRVARLAVGNAFLGDQLFLVLPLPYAVIHPRDGVTVDGLIGFEMLATFRTRIDYGRHVISFSSFRDTPVRAPGAVVLPFQSDGHTPYVEAEIDGIRGLFEIDTGANATVTIFSGFARAHGLFARGGVAYSSPGGVGGTVDEQMMRARTFDLAGTHFDTPVIALSKTTSGAFASRTIAGNIGSGILSRFTLTFDFHDRTVTFEPRPDANAPFPSDRTGLGVGMSAPGEIDVLSVAPQSPAAAAGVSPGDRIIALDGKAAGAGTLDDLRALRGGTRTFTLTTLRSGMTLHVRIVPSDLLGDPQ